MMESAHILPDLNSGDVTQMPVFRVQGKSVVARSGVILPAFCIISNEPLRPEDMETKQLEWIPPDVGVLVILAPVLGFLPYIAGYLISKEQCKITFGLSPAVRKKQRDQFVMKIIAAVVSFLVAAISAFFPTTIAFNMLLTAGLVCCIVLLLILLVGSNPLTVTKRGASGEFWIDGCSRQFLTRIDPTSQFDFLGRQAQ